MTPLQVVAADIQRSLKSRGIEIARADAEEIARSAVRRLAETYVPSPLINRGVEASALRAVHPDLVRDGYHGVLWAIVKEEPVAVS
jgi:hypothetical protein